MTHTNTVGDPVVTDVAIFLARHAAARVWRYLADNPETPDAIRMTLLEHLPGIEADPVGADWSAARRAAWEDDTTIYVAARRAASSAAAYAYAANDAYDAYDTTANAVATRAVEFGCAGSDRIGLALTLLAGARAEAVDLPDPTNAWELAGMVTEAGHRSSAGVTNPEAVEGLPG